MSEMFAFIKSGMMKMGELLKKNVKVELVMSLFLILSSTMIACNMEKIVEQESTTTKKPERKYADYTIVIDAGHGGADPGKIGVNQLLEKDVNLAIALNMEQMLKETGASIILTRQSDTGLYTLADRNKKMADMRARCEIINQASLQNEKCVVISVHQNSFTSENVKGAQVFYYSGSQGGTELAKIMQRHLNEQINVNRAKEMKENKSYYMLIHTKCPTIIVECGFLSNWEEAQNLAQDSYQQRVAGIICSALLEYLETQAGE